MPVVWTLPFRGSVSGAHFVSVRKKRRLDGMNVMITSFQIEILLKIVFFAMRKQQIHFHSKSELRENATVIEWNRLALSNK